jgi:hypothetical protein
MLVKMDTAWRSAKAFPPTFGDRGGEKLLERRRQAALLPTEGLAR